LVWIFWGFYWGQEPIAFFGGVFAGLLRLDLKEEPLREWVARTSEAAGLDLSESPSARRRSHCGSGWHRLLRLLG